MEHGSTLSRTAQVCDRETALSLAGTKRTSRCRNGNLALALLSTKV